jgi:hypothetical protein
LIHYPDRDPQEVACCPEATHTEILERHPDAVAAEPFAPTIRQPSEPLTAEAETAIRAWLALIEETDPATIAEVLTGCRQDVDVRRYFLGRADEIPADDRRRCNQCVNLRGAVCIIAKPGGIVSAIVGYRPVQGIPQRCAGYSPNADDPDQRPGRERWPGFTQRGTPHADH